VAASRSFSQRDNNATDFSVAGCTADFEWLNCPPFRPDSWRKQKAQGYLEDRLISDDYQGIELITGTARRRYWSTEQKLRIIEQSFESGETVSSVARRHGVAANLLYRWRRLMSEGGATAVGSDEPVVGSSEVRKLEDRVRELERLLGRKTMENEILRKALAKVHAKKTTLRLLSSPKGGSR
jgi:transposase